MYFVVIRARISVSYSEWEKPFLAHSDARKEAGIEDVFCHPIIGEQAILYAVKTAHPRKIHDMIYSKEARESISNSGFVIGSEELTICDLDHD